MSNRSQCSIAHPERLLAAWPLVFAIVVGGCTRTPDDVLRVGLPAAPTTLDPRYATDATSSRLCRLLYAALVDFDADFRPVPALATWEMPSPTRYRFHLPPAHRFHDGSPLTSADVVATYRAVLDPVRASPHRASLANVVAIAASDAQTVEFTLSHPDALFPGLLVIGILRAADAEAPRLGPQPVGSGAFALAEIPRPERIALTRVRDGQRVDFAVIANETTRALKLARGELDLAQGGFAPELVDWLAARPGLRVRHQPGTVFTYLGLNLARGPTADLRVRQAIAHAIDRRQLVHYLLRGQAREAETLLVPEHWAADPDLPPIVYAPTRARRLLATVGYDAQHPLRLTYKTSTDEFRRRLATALQDQLARAGIVLDIRSYDWGTLYGDIKAGRFELFSLSWVGLQLPEIFRYAFHSASVPPAGANRGHYANPEVDGLIERAERSEAPGAQRALYRAVQAHLHHDLPYIPLWYEDTVVVQGARVVGYDTDLNGHFDGLERVRAVFSHDQQTPH